MHPSVLIHTSGRDFDGFICDYVFMFFPPSFLRSWGGAVTRIRKSSQRRYATPPREGLPSPKLCLSITPKSAAAQGGVGAACRTAAARG